MRLEEFGKRWAISSLFSDTERMLESVRPDIVSICVPTRLHAECMSAVCRAGVRGIVLEKPVAVSLPEADAMVAEAEQSGAIVAMNHLRCYDPFHERARALIREGFIGTVHTVFSYWDEGWSFGGSHLFSLLRMLLDSRPVRVYCEGVGDDGPDPGGNALIAYENGARALIAAPRVGKTPKEVDLLGTEGRIRMGTYTLQLFRSDTSQGYSVPTEWPFFGRMEMRSPMTLLIEDVVEGLKGEGRVRCGITEGRDMLEIAVALNESARTGSTVTLPLEGLPQEALTVETLLG